IHPPQPAPTIKENLSETGRPKAQIAKNIIHKAPVTLEKRKKRHQMLEDFISEGNIGKPMDVSKMRL
ncbi:unnamed protein product, partial [Linum tenue]